MSSDFTLHTDDLVDNPTPRVPVVLCLDTSGSMSGEPIRELGAGVNLFYAAVHDDEIARFSAEVAVVTFGGTVGRVADFGPVEPSPGFSLSAGGGTPMGVGVCQALDLLERRKRDFKKAGVDYYQPWLVLMTDGAPTDDISVAVERVVELAEAKRLSVFSIGIGEAADMSVLQHFSPGRTPLRLKGLRFSAFFEWLSASVQRVSASTPGSDVPLDVDGIKGWGSV